MANKRIIEQTASTTISNDDWLIKDSPTDGTTKIQASVFKTLMNDGMASNEDLADAIENIAGEYDSEVEYSKDALCFKDGVLYIANADTTGTWDSTKWDTTTIADIIANLRIDANDVVDVKVKGDSLVNSSKIAVLDSLTAQGSASGSIASFSDGSTHPMSKLEVAIDPIQDLHGYDYPWAGGAGKNKLGSSSYGGNYGKVVGDDLKTGTAQSYNITTDGTITVESVAAWSGVLFVTPPLEAGSYSIPTQEISVPSGSNPRCGVYITDSNLIVKSAVSYKQYAGNYPQTDITVESGDRIAYGVSNSVANSSTTITNFYVAKTSDLPSGYTPYSNICPISGFTEANVVVSPLNISQLYNGQIYGDGSWVVNNARLTNVQTAQSNDYFLKAGTYTLDYDKLNSNAPNLLQCSLLTKDSNFNIVENFANAWNSLPFTFTLTQDGYLYFTIRKNADTNINPSDYRAKVLGQTYNVEFKDGSNPLTVYGGTLDVVSGELTVDRASVDLGTLSWSYNNIQHFFYANLNDLKLTTKNLICDRYIYVEKSWATMQNGEFGKVENSTQIRFHNDNYETAADFKTAMDGVQLVYELATPQTYQLTPTQVKSLLGTNNVWADTGEVLEAEYVRDVTSTINDIFARLKALEEA